MDLSVSSLVQGQSQEALVHFIGSLVATNGGGGFPSLYSQLLAKINSDLSKPSITNLSKCIAISIINSPADVKQAAIAELMAPLLNNGDDYQLILSMFTLAVVGRTIDLSSHANISNLIHNCFSHHSEDIKRAAAYTLGHLAVKNLAIYLPIILNVTESSKNYYLLLVSIKEIIVVFSECNDMSYNAYATQITPSLFRFCDAEEESVRSMVADCLGALICLQDTSVMTMLETMAAQAIVDANARILWTVIMSYRYALSKAHERDALLFRQLSKNILSFFPLISTHDDLEVLLNFIDQQIPISDFLGSASSVIDDQCWTPPQLCVDERVH
jgi:cullin-associated NEDD8-dissociated protein 1